jgi:hypothetical protein
LDVVANVLGIAVRSMKMRISNHRAIDTGEGLRNFSAKSRRVSETFGALSCAELEAELLSRVPALSTAENDAKGSA